MELVEGVREELAEEVVKPATVARVTHIHAWPLADSRDELEVGFKHGRR